MSSIFSVSSVKSVSLQSLRGDWLHNRSLGGGKNGIVCHLFCMFIIIIIIIPSFVVMLNCLYLSSGVLLFVHSPPQPAGGREERGTDLPTGPIPQGSLLPPWGPG